MLYRLFVVFEILVANVFESPDIWVGMDWDLPRDEAIVNNRDTIERTFCVPVVVVVLTRVLLTRLGFVLLQCHFYYYYYCYFFFWESIRNDGPYYVFWTNRSSEERMSSTTPTAACSFHGPSKDDVGSSL